VIDAVAVGRGRPPAARRGEGARVELSPMRQTIAERMAASKQTAPHFYLIGDVRMGEAMAMLARLKEEGTRVTVTGLLVKAVGLALREHPRLNARFDDGAVVRNAACNVGVAVAVEDGLFVPVIRDADAKALPVISAELKSLAERARESKLIPEQYEGGCITISNLGMYGVGAFLPIINPPESAIIGVGTVAEQPVARDGGIAVEAVMKLSLSADHRVVDGAEAAAFFQTLKGLLEEPGRIPA
jgi:pyruvate dehydrogenase E2 component (dihydrolipoamide acetyltransferase)